ncbi:uncharacterized protein PV09_05066 [Verruconis gallopava]|uniref:Uncharacterized protein n=1 Tax=Verruconis gallopava TaxID=253628 RepID=A0A0D1XMK5_9PEZI|nr:uncharacterized protein PV09_05066 [Verruconis gallopava]KIW03761.1 hypothetical protein PV09_05066 [Verruconis gallopava]
MSPNPFTLVKLAFSPHKWSTRRSSSVQSMRPREQWELPVPGIYEYKPGRGWYLVEYIENADTGSVSDLGTATTAKHERLPRKVVYCKVLHRMMFETEYEDRRRFEYVKTNSSFDVQQLGFFRLDDNVTYVPCWDRFGHFIEGPYERWCVDPTTKRMRPMKFQDAVIEGQERESRRDSWERTQKQSVSDVSAPCSVCSSPSVTSLRKAKYEGRDSISTIATNSRAQGTALTTPSSGVLTSQTTSDEVNAEALHAELMKLRDP